MMISTESSSITGIETNFSFMYELKAEISELTINETNNKNPVPITIAKDFILSFNNPLKNFSLVWVLLSKPYQAILEVPQILR